jgi:Asp-tRNA(Asn)/Glu-tRNA(Gln) amidotransferase A subunit family amidase
VLQDDYLRLSAVDIALAVNARELSAEEVVEAALSRVEEVDDTVRAFREIWSDRARTAAREVDRRREHLPLAGVPIGLKATEGAASQQARLLLAAGAIPIGTTATPGPGTTWQTWGLTDRGPTLNPWNHELVPGGSSAGSAVAVATSMVPLATGSDGAGSIRIPAAWCGVLGFKPTNGRLRARDRAGLNTGGVLARHPADLWAYLTTTTGLRETPPRTRRPRVAWSEDLGFACTSPEVAEVARAALTRLVSSGLVEEVNLPVELVDPEGVWSSLRNGGDDRGVKAENDRRLAEVFESTDLIATPTTPNQPHGHDGPGEVLSVALTWAFNLSGHPALSLPAGFAGSSSSVGLQLVARPGDEAGLLAVAGGKGCGGVRV